MDRARYEHCSKRGAQTPLSVFATHFGSYDSYGAWPQASVAEKILKIVNETAAQAFADL